MGKSIAKKSLFCIVADTGGAHEAECVYSAWSSKKKAENEIKRLHKNNVTAGCYSGGFYIYEIKLNQSYNEWIG